MTKDDKKGGREEHPACDDMADGALQKQHDDALSVSNDSEATKTKSSTKSSIKTEPKTPPVSETLSVPEDLRKAHMRAKRKRRRKWYLGFVAFLLVLVAAFALVWVSLSATRYLVPLPQWATQKLESQLNTLNPQVQMSIAKVAFGVSPSGSLRVHIVDLGVRDDTGLEIARLNAVDADFLARPLLSGQTLLQSVSLTGAQVTVRRRRDGTFDLSLGQGVNTSGNLASVLDRIDAVFQTGALERTNFVSATELTLTLEDARSGRLWQVTDGRMNLEQSDTHVDMTLAFDVFNQTESLAQTVLGVTSAKDSSAAQLTATFKNARARDIAAQTPLLSFLEVVDAPISGALHTVIDAEGLMSNLAGTLEFGAGNLSPNSTVKPVKFTGAKVYLDFDPTRDRMEFTQIALQTDWGELEAEGHAYLRGWQAGLPREFLGQLALSSALITPPDIFENPLELSSGAADFRLSLDPFSVEVGQYSMGDGVASISGSARIGVDGTGWDVALNAASAQLSPEQVTKYWPLTYALKSRNWVAQNVTKGRFTDVSAAWRKQGGALAQTAITASFDEASVRVVRDMAPIENASGLFALEGTRLAVSLASGELRPNDRAQKHAGVISVAGSQFVIPKMGRRLKDPNAKKPPVPSKVNLVATGPVKAVLHLLDGKPFQVFKASTTGAVGPNMASGAMALSGRIDIALQPIMPRDAIVYDLKGELFDVHSNTIVQGRDLNLKTGQVTVTNEAVIIAGDASLSGVPVSGQWQQKLSQGKALPVSTLQGTLRLNQAFLDAFSIAIPKGYVSGAAVADYQIDLERGVAPRMKLASSLKGLGLEIGAINWRKSKPSKGRLSVSGRLGELPVIDDITLDASGLFAQGRVELKEGGGLKAVTFNEVRVGRWLDAPVTLKGRGADRSVGIEIKGGHVDLRYTNFGTSKSSSNSKDPVPLKVNLDSLTVSKGIRLSGFQGDFTQRSGGLNGTFKGRLKNGPSITGTAVPQPKGTAFRVRSKNAGGVLRASGIFTSARDGTLELLLVPTGKAGVYDGDLSIKKIDVHGAPAIAGLLSAVSVVGLVQQLDGKGILFEDVTARFRLDPEKITVFKSAARGHSMGISMDGYYHLGSEKLNMQGVISPVFVLNSIGQVFARRGEGLIGFNYRLKGTASDPKVSVNPLSVLLPGILRDIFRSKPPPDPNAS